MKAKREICHKMDAPHFVFWLALSASVIAVGNLASELNEGGNTMPETKGEATKYLTLHQELLYPAFLGAVLFEFAKKIIEDGFFEFFDKVIHGGLSNELLWFISALWFLLYFTVAFFALKDPEARDKFGILAFGANLFEIGVILYVAGSIQLIKPHGYTGGLNYNGIYWGWIWITITAAASNLFSKRRVHWRLGIIASLVGVFGLAVVGSRMNGYFGVLSAMYVLLGIYFCKVFRSKPE
jgi:hypothetical protein